MFVFDTETRTDATQRLTFGSYRFIVAGQCLKESCSTATTCQTKIVAFSNATLPLTRRKRRGRRSAIGFATREELVARCISMLTKGGAFWSRSISPSTCRGLHTILQTRDAVLQAAFHSASGRISIRAVCEREDRYRPRISIKQIDSKRALKGLTGRKEYRRRGPHSGRITTGRPEEDYIFRGHFLDLRTLAFALTDRDYSLGTGVRSIRRRACQTARNATRYRHKEIHRLQSARCPGDIGTSRSNCLKSTTGIPIRIFRRQRRILRPQLAKRICGRCALSQSLSATGLSQTISRVRAIRIFRRTY